MKECYEDDKTKVAKDLIANNQELSGYYFPAMWIQHSSLNQFLILFKTHLNLQIAICTNIDRIMNFYLVFIFFML